MQTLEDLARPGVSIAVAAKEVPAGAYTLNALELMAGSPDFPDDFAASALANVVTNETNVRAVAQKVALGEVDAGLIYETDAAAGQYAGVVPPHRDTAPVQPGGAVSDCVADDGGLSGGCPGVHRLCTERCRAGYSKGLWICSSDQRRLSLRARIVGANNYSPLR